MLPPVNDSATLRRSPRSRKKLDDAPGQGRIVYGVGVLAESFGKHAQGVVDEHFGSAVVVQHFQPLVAVLFGKVELQFVAAEGLCLLDGALHLLVGGADGANDHLIMFDRVLRIQGGNGFRRPLSAEGKADDELAALFDDVALGDDRLQNVAHAQPQRRHEGGLGDDEDIVVKVFALDQRLRKFTHVVVGDDDRFIGRVSPADERGYDRLELAAAEGRPLIPNDDADVFHLPFPFSAAAAYCCEKTARFLTI